MNMPNFASCHQRMRRSRSASVEVCASDLRAVMAVTPTRMPKYSRRDRAGKDIFVQCSKRPHSIMGFMRAMNGRIIRPEILDDLPLAQKRRSLEDLTLLNRQSG